jgi:serine phosphatase RsbU (regulator of sigma subunit)
VRDGLAPREIAVRLNAMMLDALPPQSFIGLFYAAVDLSSGTVRYVNCGHTPPVVVRSPEGGATSALFTGNIVLGVEADPTYDEAEITLGEGDFLVCCTDGVTEAMDEEWRPLDTEGVARAAAAARGGTADEVAEQILAAAREHTARRVTDDATLLVLRRVPRVGG